MIDYISIKNFRCFEETQIGGFGTVNLIGGLNNSGKTALLEALLLAFLPTAKALEKIRRLRKEVFENTVSTNTWRYLFHNQEDTKPIFILSKNKKIQYSSLEIKYSQNTDDIAQLDNKLINLEFRDLSNFSGLLMMGESQNTPFQYLQIHSKEGNYVTGKKPIHSELEIEHFIYYSFKKDNTKLSSLYSLADRNKKIDQFDALLNLLDNRIRASKIMVDEGKPQIELVNDQNQSFPLKMFGDAVQKVVEILLTLLATSQTVLLIDEIENGLHYTKQADFWKALFHIAENQKTQIFATTHSREMIKTFAEVAENQANTSGVYFQMYRSLQSQQIVAAPYTS